MSSKHLPLFIAACSLLGGALTWDIHHISNIAIEVGRMMHIQDIVWFLSEELSTADSTNLDEFMGYMNAGFGVPQTVITNDVKMRMRGSSAQRNHFSVILTTGVGDPIMHVCNKVLTTRHSYFGLIVLPQNITDMQPVYDMCQYIDQYNFVSLIIYFQTAAGLNQIFGVSKFPEMKIHNLSDYIGYLRSNLERILRKWTDTGGYKFLTPLSQDLPHLFYYLDARDHIHYEGTTFRNILSFVNLLNASFGDLAIEKNAYGGDIVNMKSVLELVRKRKIEFSAHAYALFQPDEMLEKSYPLLVVQWCLMVPLYNTISTFLYPLQPFEWTVWVFIIGAFVALNGLELLWIYFTSRHYHAHIDDMTKVQAVILDNFCYIINIAAPKPLRNPSTLRFMLLVTIFFHGFFLTANYTSVLGSILAVNLFHAQINTMEDLINAKLPVMIIDYEREFLSSWDEELPKEFQALLMPVDAATFTAHQHSFNKSYAYFVTEDKWQFLDQQQQHLKQKLFKFSKICFGSYQLAYPMQMDSIFWRQLEYYTFHMHSSGLLTYYERSAFDYAVHAKLMVRMQENNEFSSAGLQHLAMAFAFVFIMFVLAGIVFILELVWMPNRLSVRNRPSVKRSYKRPIYKLRSPTRLRLDQ